jgi:hypothetical protein
MREALVRRDSWWSELCFVRYDCCSTSSTGQKIGLRCPLRDKGASLDPSAR